MNQDPKAPASRLPFLDWARGLVAVVMLQGHTFHSLTRKEYQEGAAYVFSQFMGGLAPAVFLFLTGTTYGFIMTRNERKGMPPMQKWIGALHRAGYLWLLAFAFRFQLWAFALGQSPWTDLLKVDILNCMAMTLTLLSPLAILPAARRIQWGMGAAVVIAFLAPLPATTGLGHLPTFLAEYFTPSYNYFSVLPWGAFAAFGIAFGTLLRQINREDLWRSMQWAALVGFALFLAGRYFADFPYTLYNKSEFWLDSPTLTIIKSGLILILLALAYLWNEFQPADRWSWVRQIGTNSLLVYWVHIELIYGRWLAEWKQNLEPLQAGCVAVCLVLLMLALSVARTRWAEWGHVVFPRWIAAPAPAKAKQVAGD